MVRRAISPAFVLVPEPSRHRLYQTDGLSRNYKPMGGRTLRGFTAEIIMSVLPAGMGMMMMMQMYFTATTHVTLWFQRWHTNSSAWCHPSLSHLKKYSLKIALTLVGKP